MSVVLVLKCAALGFALAVAATVGVLAGPVSAGLALVTFLLGVAANELFHMRLSPVEEGAQSDSAFLALMEAGRAGAPAEAAPDVATAAPEPPPPPKRNFRATRTEMATGSGRLRTELSARSRRVSPQVARPPSAEPVAAEPVAAEPVAPEPRSWPVAEAEPMPAPPEASALAVAPVSEARPEPVAGSLSFRTSYVERASG